MEFYEYLLLPTGAYILRDHYESFVQQRMHEMREQGITIAFWVLKEQRNFFTDTPLFYLWPVNSAEIFSPDHLPPVPLPPTTTWISSKATTWIKPPNNQPLTPAYRRWIFMMGVTHQFGMVHRIRSRVPINYTSPAA